MGFINKFSSILANTINKKSSNKLDKTEPTLSSAANEAAKNDSQLFDPLIKRLKSYDTGSLTSNEILTSVTKNAEDINTFIETLSDKQKTGLLLKLIPLLHKERYLGENYWPRTYLIELLINTLIKSKAFLDDEDVDLLIKCFVENTPPNLSILTIWPINSLLGKLIKQHKQRTLSEQLVTTVKQLNTIADAFQVNYGYSDKQITKKIEALLTQNLLINDQIQSVYFYDADDFAKLANANLAALSREDTQCWPKLMALAKKTTGAKPTLKFLTEAKSFIEKLGHSSFSRVVSEWFQFIIDNKDPLFTYQIGASNFVLCSNNVEMVKCFVWMCACLPDDKLIPLLGELADRCFQKIPQKGHASDALGNACLFALYQSPGIAGIAQLSRLQLRIKQNKTLQLIAKYLLEAAKNQGMTVSELEDLSVPDFDLVKGKKRWLFDSYSAEIRIIGVGKTETQWFKADGITQKSVPTFVKETYVEEFKQLKATAKSIEQCLTVQRDRIDRMFRMNRTMSWVHFKKYYLNHPLLGFITKQLIWNFTDDGQTIAAIYLNGEWKNNLNQRIDFPEQSTVSLWHPATSAATQTLLWRDFLQNNLIQQPIKQAYREVYLLTEAEANTKSYSNRMAAHILKQHQFSSLAKGRGWTYSLLGAWDGGDAGIAEIRLEPHNLYAQYWAQAVQADNALNESGVWNYVSTDQVRFLRLESDETIDLVDIPAIVFSEVMRDVDLFVGVASVGNDPNWHDSGGIPAYQTYWHAYSFGDLSEIAKTRKTILEKLIPRLKIKDVTEVKDKFVVVKGKLRTYKIHIGSTNILMEPNDQYLCIVPNQHKSISTEQIFLPFEGDSGLSIILSKAFLLAGDDKITESTITSQLKLK